MWQIGRVLTELMRISKINNIPPPNLTIKAGADLFDALGRYNYGIAIKKEIKEYYSIFVNELEGKYLDAFVSTIQYAKDFSKDLLKFLKENNLY